MTTERRWRRWAIAGGAVVVVLAVAAVVVWRVYFADSTTIHTVDEAVEDFRASTTIGGTAAAPTTTATTVAPTTAASTTAPPTTAPPAMRLPEPGVYVYATSGSESIDALTGARHEYPAESSITVTAGGCGVVVRWQPLAERYDEYDLCLSPTGGLDTTTYTSFHKFFNQDDKSTYTCPPGTPFVPPAAATGTAWPASCTSGETVDTTQWKVVGTAPMTIGGTTVSAVQLRGEDTFTDPDGSNGTTGIDLWVDAATGLTLRRVEQGTSTTKSPVGDIHYVERIDLTLTSLTPRR